MTWLTLGQSIWNRLGWLGFDTLYLPPVWPPVFLAACWSRAKPHLVHLKCHKWILELIGFPHSTSLVHQRTLMTLKLIFDYDNYDNFLLFFITEKNFSVIISNITYRFRLRLCGNSQHQLDFWCYDLVSLPCDIPKSLSVSLSVGGTFQFGNFLCWAP